MNNEIQYTVWLISDLRVQLGQPSGVILTAGISFIHSSIHQTYILAVHASIHAQIPLSPALLALYAYALPHSAREPGQERVYQYKGGLRDL
jgi:hypothetical protein